MAVTLSRTRSAHLHLPRMLSEQHVEIAINRNNNLMLEQKKEILVPVVYYLCRNGKLEHPHFVEVPLSSPRGLLLRDVIYRLNLLRGKSMAAHYSWSSKRCYKNGYVWHDLEENDFIHPVHGGEYVLKGSEITEPLSSALLSVSKSTETSSTGKNDNVVSTTTNNEFAESSSRITRRRNQSWGSIDLNEYKVYKAEVNHEFAVSDASTQTDEKRRRKNAAVKEEAEMELSREEISVIPPPLSDSSQETLVKLIKKSDGKSIVVSHVKCDNAESPVSSSSLTVDQVAGEVDRTAGNCPSGRMKASSVLMSLISCGSISFRDCGATAVKDHGLPLISHYKPRRSCGEDRMVGDIAMKTNNDSMLMEKNVSSSFAKMALEDKEYFSGSLIENSKNNYKEDPQFISLKRSTSYNADRSSYLKLEGKEVDELRAKCIPRRPKAQPSNKQECILETSSITITSPHKRLRPLMSDNLP